MSKLPEYFGRHSRLAKNWDLPLSASAALPDVAFNGEIAERHTIYSLLLMALVNFYWNGNKNGARDIEYTYRSKQRRPDGTYSGDPQGDRYLGHNIGAFAVDASGRIVDFDFNHNKAFNSSVQHAEARLIRRMFGLAAVQDSWDLSAGKKEYRTDLKNTVVYTSLESCAQCAGIMALASVPVVIFLQPDPGQYMIGQILRNLSDVNVPLHIPAKAFNFPYHEQLLTSYQQYQRDIEGGAVFSRSPNGKEDKGPGITNFLCTDPAKEIYAAASAHFQEFTCQHGAFRPKNEVTGGAGLSNEEVLNHSRQFFAYATAAGQRGTPHFN